MINIDNIEISKMKVSDLDEIKDNLQNDFYDFWNYEIFKAELVNNTCSYLVLRYNNEIVCFGGLKIILDEAELMIIATRQDKRGNGYAKYILKELINIANTMKLNKINLEVNENNKVAIHLYEMFDFKQVGLRKKYYNNTDNAILMTLII